MRAGTAVALPLVLGVVLVAGCDSDKQSDTADDQVQLSAGGASPSEEPPTTPPAVSKPEPTYSASAHFVPDAQALADRAKHRNYGYLAVLSEKPSVQLSWDKALWLGGNEANKAAFEHGDETPVPNDHYIVNDSKQLRTVTLASKVRVVASINMNSYRGGDQDPVAARDSSVPELLRFLRGPYAKSTGFDLAFDKAGLVVRVEEQYQP
jgi:hypothetical protein